MQSLDDGDNNQCYNEHDDEDGKDDNDNGNDDSENDLMSQSRQLVLSTNHKC